MPIVVGRQASFMLYKINLFMSGEVSCRVTGVGMWE